eukprot:m.39424 g.39424  ORF g.39424 m.39424 type:complete len:972 (+) comp32740_c0_seq1:82-2997(+)
MTGERLEQPSETQDKNVQKLREVLGIDQKNALKLYMENGEDVMKAIEAETSRQADPFLPLASLEGPEKAWEEDETELKNSRTLADPQKAVTIDLTRSEDDDLQRALALSLQDTGHVSGAPLSKEDQDLSRAVEASMADSKHLTKRRRYDSWLLHVDPLDPHERVREGDHPVGLKNVGNTCWFSAVIQSLFHLPLFRNHVASVQLAGDEPECEQRKLSPAICFVRELRDLFALLLKSKRKYVDPSQAVQKLRSTFASSATQTANQQDISEFNHLLMEWLEEAFSVNSSSENPILNLFYGKFRTIGTNEGKAFTTEGSFGAYPLPVQGFPDLHSSLGGSMIQREIEPVCVLSESAVKSEQETWFIHLPPVLILELSRFDFNQTEGKAQKIHNRMAFEEIMFMDRYMEENKEISHTKRQEEYKLKERLSLLEKQLEKYTSYGGKRVALKDVLDLSLEFVQTKRSRCDEPESQDEWMQTSPVLGTQGLHVDDPAPQYISARERETLSTCFQRWKEEVKEEEQRLREDVENVKSQLNCLYNIPELQKVCYGLHAVLVHEGQATGGHYWAYIRDHFTQTWMKYNDISILPVTWEEVEKESFGTHLTASAYCLFYINEEEADRIACKSAAFVLPENLMKMVEDDNENFQKEIDDFDARKEVEEATQNIGLDQISQSEILVSESCETLASGDLQGNLSKLVNEQLEKVVEDIETHVKNLTLEAGSTEDVRLLHYLCFLELTNCPPAILLHALMVEGLQKYPFDQLPEDCRAEARNILSKTVEQAALRVKEEAKHWREAYRQFALVYAVFISGLELLVKQNQSFSALSYVINAAYQNAQLSELTSPVCCVSTDLLQAAIRLCLDKANEASYTKFQSGETFNSCDEMCKFVIPCLHILQSSDNKEDEHLIESVSSMWFHLVSEERSEENAERLQVIVEKLYETPTIESWEDTGLLREDLIISDSDLSGRFTSVFIRLGLNA